MQINVVMFFCIIIFWQWLHDQIQSFSSECYLTS